MAAGEGLQDVQYLSSGQTDERISSLVKKSSDIVLANHIEPRDDMLEERRRASFDASSLAAYLNGGQEKLQRLCAHTSPPWLGSSPFHHLILSGLDSVSMLQRGACRPVARSELGQQEQALLLESAGNL